MEPEEDSNRDNVFIELVNLTNDEQNNNINDNLNDNLKYNNNIYHQKHLTEWSVIVIGNSRVGKSSLCNLMLGKKAFEVGCDLDSVTQNSKLEQAHITKPKELNLNVVDTVGFTDNVDQSIEKLSQIMCYFPNGINAILLAISAAHGIDVSSNILKILEKSFPDDSKVWNYVILVLTRVKNKDREAFESSISKNYSTSENFKRFQHILQLVKGRYIMTNNKPEDRDAILQKIEKLNEANKFQMLSKAYGKTSIVNKTNNNIHVGFCHVGPLAWMNDLPSNCRWDSAIVPGIYTVKVLPSTEDEKGFNMAGAIGKPLLFGVTVASLPVTSIFLPEIALVGIAGAYSAKTILLLRIATPAVVAAIEAAASISSNIIRTEYSHVGWRLGFTERWFEIYGGDKDIFKKDDDKECPLSFEPFIIAEIFQENGQEVRKFHKSDRPITLAMQHLIFEELKNKSLKCNGCYTADWAEAVVNWKKKNNIDPPSPIIDKFTLKRFFKKIKFVLLTRHSLVVAIKILLKKKYPFYGKLLSFTSYYVCESTYSSTAQIALNEFIKNVPGIMFRSPPHAWSGIVGDFDDNLEEDEVNEFVWAALFGDCDPWFVEI